MMTRGVRGKEAISGCLNARKRCAKRCMSFLTHVTEDERVGERCIDAVISCIFLFIYFNIFRFVMLEMWRNCFCLCCKDCTEGLLSIFTWRKRK